MSAPRTGPPVSPPGSKGATPRQRRVLVSGGTSGIGLACARRLVAAGHGVYVIGSRPEKLQAALAATPGLHGAVCDVTDERGVADSVAAASACLGGLDGAFVNAGIDGAGVPGAELEVSFLRHVLEVNVVGAFLVARAALEVMQRPARLVFNASVNAIRPERNFLDYNASKAAVLSMAKTFALELGGSGVTVTAVCPGYFPTAMTEPYLADPTIRSELLAHIPAGRFGELHELASLVEFLLGPEAGFLHGAAIPVDGGSSI